MGQRLNNRSFTSITWQWFIILFSIHDISYSKLESERENEERDEFHQMREDDPNVPVLMHLSNKTSLWPFFIHKIWWVFGQIYIVLVAGRLIVFICLFQ